MDIDPRETLLTARETARYLRCSLRTLDRERADGRGCPFIRIGGRIRYRRADVEAFVAAHVRGNAARAVLSSDTAQSRRHRLSKHVAHGGAAQWPPPPSPLRSRGWCGRVRVARNPRPRTTARNQHRPP